MLVYIPVFLRCLRIRLARYIERINNLKNDWIHKITHKIVNKNQAGKIVVEDLNIKGMLKNEKLSKYIHWNSWNKFIVILNYKAKRNGIELIKTDRFYASSQICNVCGYKNEEVKDLNTRRWVCPECGREHDRDVNAAKNIANYVMLSVGQGLSEIKPVDHALTAERKENSSGLRVNMG